MDLILKTLFWFVIAFLVYKKKQLKGMIPWWTVFSVQHIFKAKLLRHNVYCIKRLEHTCMVLHWWAIYVDWPGLTRLCMFYNLVWCCVVLSECAGWWITYYGAKQHWSLTGQHSYKTIVLRTTILATKLRSSKTAMAWLATKISGDDRNTQKQDRVSCAKVDKISWQKISRNKNCGA